MAGPGLGPVHYSRKHESSEHPHDFENLQRSLTPGEHQQLSRGNQQGDTQYMNIILASRFLVPGA